MKNTFDIITVGSAWKILVYRTDKVLLRYQVQKIFYHEIQKMCFKCYRV